MIAFDVGMAKAFEGPNLCTLGVASNAECAKCWWSRSKVDVVRATNGIFHPMARSDVNTGIVYLWPREHSQ